MKAVKITKPLYECRSPGDYMRYAREKRGLSLMALSKASGVTDVTIWQWEHDARSPSLSLLISVCVKLGCSLDEYVGFGAIRSD